MSPPQSLRGSALGAAHRWIGRLSFVVVLGCVAPTPGDDDDAQPTPEPTPDPRFDPLRDVIEAERERLGAPGVAIGLWVDGEPVFVEGLGTKEDGEDEPVLGSTLFRIGSVTKMMTAAAVMHEVDAGTVTLETPLSDVWPGFDLSTRPGWADGAQVGHLLDHGCALMDYLEIDATRDESALEEWVFEGAAAELPAWAPSGRFWNYSNPCYMLAGLVAETVSGRSYRETLDATVLGPLGMSRTTFLADEVLADGDYATGRSWDWDGGAELRDAGPDDYDNAWARPAGYLWSSVEDLSRFAHFLLDGNTAVLSPTSREAMVTERRTMRSLGDHEMYALGVMVTDGFATEEGWYDEALWTHGGAIPGFAAELFVLPERRVVFASLANTDGAYFRESFAAALPYVTDIGEPGPVPALPPREDLSDLAGTWDDTYNIGAWTLTWEEGDLHVDAPVLDQYDVPYGTTLIPFREDSFIWNIDGTQQIMGVVRDDGGAPEYLVFRFSVSVREDEGQARGQATARDVASFRRALRQGRW